METKVLLLGILFFILVLGELIFFHVILIRYFFFDKKCDDKLLVAALINCIPTVIIFLAYQFVKNKFNENLK